MSARIWPVPLIAFTLVVAACTSETSPTTQPPALPPDTTAAPAPTTTQAAAADESMSEDMVTLTFEVSGLEPLAGGFHYEGWAIVDGTPATTGKFNVDETGQLVDLDGGPIQAFELPMGVEEATDLVITIEPAGDTDDVPAVTKILGGSVQSGAATLTTVHPAALGDDFAAASGTYILATPTDGSGTNELSGIWWVHFEPRMPSLVLATLPDGWRYEGWVVIDGNPVTTGRFLAVDEADEAAPFSGPEAGPPFPGEDFLVNAPDGLVFPLDLSGRLGVISIEPHPDDSPAPFTLKPLVGDIPDPASDHTNYEMSNAADAFPTIQAEIGS